MLSKKQIDTITEIINIGVGKGAASLSQMIDGEIILNVPYVNVIQFNDVKEELMKLAVNEVHAVELYFSGEYDGTANVILSSDSAEELVSILLHEDKGSANIQEMKDGIMIEVGNIILNAIMGSFGNILNAPLDYHMPKSFQGEITGLYNELDEQKYSQVLICRTNFSVSGKSVEGELLIMYEMKSFDKLKHVLDKMIGE